MSEKKKKPIPSFASIIAIIVGLFSWLAIYVFFLNGTFEQMPPNSVLDLSKTLIQSFGILVSLIIASSFVYIGKMDELSIRILSEENELDTKETLVRNKMKDATIAFQSCSTRLANLDNNKLDESGLQTKKKLEKTLNKIENHLKEHTEFLEKTVKSDIKELIDEIEKAKGQTIGLLALDIGFFLISIILAITAFAYESGARLGNSLLIIVIGMILIFAVWYYFYTLSLIMRKFFRFVLSTKSYLLVVSDCTENCKSELDDASASITALSKT